jgi:hypothetical protein
MRSSATQRGLLLRIIVLNECFHKEQPPRLISFLETEADTALLTIRFQIEFSELKPLNKKRNLQKVS